MKKLIAIAAVSLLFSGCATTKSDAVDSCLFSGRATKVTMDYEGQTVGFCCNNCKGKFEAMSDTEKKAKIAAANK